MSSSLTSIASETIEEELETHKSNWLDAEKCKLPLKVQLRAIVRKQSVSKKFIQSYMQAHELSEMNIGESSTGERIVLVSKTVERVVWNEDRVSDLFDDPSTLATYKEQNNLVKTSFGVKRQRIGE
jgi:hypothetical protein|tara:strand:+ start:3582 stop:3959 length:378 start_codon:yes stop_codon:yes gene_type:complete